MQSYINYAVKATIMVAVGLVILNTLTRRVPVIGPQAQRLLGGI